MDPQWLQLLHGNAHETARTFRAKHLLTTQGLCYDRSALQLMRCAIATTESCRLPFVSWAPFVIGYMMPVPPPLPVKCWTSKSALPGTIIARCSGFWTSCHLCSHLFMKGKCDAGTHRRGTDPHMVLQFRNRLRKQKRLERENEKLVVILKPSVFLQMRQMRKAWDKEMARVSTWRVQNNPNT